MSLTANFQRHLDAELVLNDGQRIEAHRLRYNVYCQERGYEDPANFPDKMERDEFDKNAVQALVRHRASEQVAGVVRLVFPDGRNPENPLPIELHCGDTFNHAVLSRFKFSRNRIAEVSRFAVSNHFINGSSHGNTPDDDDPGRYFPHISLGLIAMLFVASAQHQVTHWFAVMEPSLSRLLSRSGIDFTPIGPVTDYHGRRQPMIARINDLLISISHKRRDFFELIESLGGIPATFATDIEACETVKHDVLLGRIS
jgi:N-acyl amino acid synthase of PEP-CTERM/exosortase system